MSLDFRRPLARRGEAVHKARAGFVRSNVNGTYHATEAACPFLLRLEPSTREKRLALFSSIRGTHTTSR